MKRIANGKRIWVGAFAASLIFISGAAGDDSPPFLLIPDGMSPSAAQRVNPFTLVLAPSPQSKWAILAIAPTAPGLRTLQNDAGLARFALSQISRNGNWQRSSVFVIRNRKAADLFRKLQSKNQGKTIDLSNFRDMTTIWNNTSAYYEVRGKKARVFYPQKSRLPWWKILR